MAVKQKRKPSNMKGMTIGGGHKRPTKSGAGLTKKGVAKYSLLFLPICFPLILKMLQ